MDAAPPSRDLSRCRGRTSVPDDANRRSGVQKSRQAALLTARAAYVSDPCATTRGVAARFGIPYSTLARRAAAEDWQGAQQAQARATATAAVRLAQRHRIKGLARLLGDFGQSFQELRQVLDASRANAATMTQADLKAHAQALHLTLEGLATVAGCSLEELRAWVPHLLEQLEEERKTNE